MEKDIYIHFIIFTLPFYSKKVNTDFTSDDKIPTLSDLKKCVVDSVDKLYQRGMIKGDEIPEGEFKFVLLNCSTFLNE